MPNVANFDGILTDNVVITKDISWPAGSQAASAFAWIKTTKNSAATQFILSYGQWGTSLKNWLLDDESGVLLVDNWGDAASTGVAINDGKWHFVGFSYAGGATTSVTGYVDGTPYALTLTGTPNVYTGSGSVANIGYGAGGATSYFNGSIADVQIYNVSLSQAQVNQLYTNDSVMGVAPVAWFPLSGGVGGLLNETPNLAFPNNIGYFGSCTSSNVINNQCGVREAQP